MTVTCTPGVILVLLRPAVTSTLLHVAQRSVQTARVLSTSAAPRPAKPIATVLQTTSAQGEQMRVLTARSALAAVKLKVPSVKVTKSASTLAA